jgi:hypothetical protein
VLLELAVQALLWHGWISAPQGIYGARRCKG